MIPTCILKVMSLYRKAGKIGAIAKSDILSFSFQLEPNSAWMLTVYYNWHVKSGMPHQWKICRNDIQ